MKDRAPTLFGAGRSCRRTHRSRMRRGRSPPVPDGPHRRGATTCGSVAQCLPVRLVSSVSSRLVSSRLRRVRRLVGRLPGGRVQRQSVAARRVVRLEGELPRRDGGRLRGVRVRRRDRSVQDGVRGGQRLLERRSVQQQEVRLGCDVRRPAHVEVGGKDCSPYVCDTTGTCASACRSSDECASGTVCDPPTQAGAGFERLSLDEGSTGIDGQGTPRREYWLGFFGRPPGQSPRGLSSDGSSAASCP